MIHVIRIAMWDLKKTLTKYTPYAKMYPNPTPAFRGYYLHCP